MGDVLLVKESLHRGSMVPSPRRGDHFHLHVTRRSVPDAQMRTDLNRVEILGKSEVCPDILNGDIASGVRSLLHGVPFRLGDQDEETLDLFEQSLRCGGVHPPDAIGRQTHAVSHTSLYLIMIRIDYDYLLRRLSVREGFAQYHANLGIKRT